MEYLQIFNQKREMIDEKISRDDKLNLPEGKRKQAMPPFFMLFITFSIISIGLLDFSYGGLEITLFIC